MDRDTASRLATLWAHRYLPAYGAFAEIRKRVRITVHLWPSPRCLSSVTCSSVTRVISDGTPGQSIRTGTLPTQRKQRRLGARALSIACCSGLTVTMLAGCSRSDDQEALSKAEDVSPTSVPAAEPPSGDTRDVDLPGDGVSDLVVSGQSDSPVIAGLSGGKMVIGTSSDWTNGKPKSVDLGKDCKDLSRAAGGGFSVACENHVLVFDGQGKKVHDLEVDGTATTAAVTSDVVSVTFAGEKKIKYFPLDGSDKDGKATVSIGEGAIQSLIVDPDPKSGSDKEMSAVFDKKQSSLTGVYPGEDKEGSSLRIGQGAGKIAGGQDGVVVASSTKLNSIEIFTANDILRKHQTIHTDSVPWGVAWDANTRTVWVTSTGKNTVIGYDISSGVPVKVATMHTIPDAQSVVVDGDGGLLIASPQSSTVQHISKDQVSEARHEGTSSEPSYPVKKEA